jgi:AraC-like DNA-binding protein
MYSKSLNSATESSPTIALYNPNLQDYTVSNNFLELRLKELSDELKNVKVQLSSEAAKREQAEQALKQQQSFCRTTSCSILAASCNWTASSKNKIVPEKPSIFPVNSQLNPVFQFIEDNYHQPINLSDVANAVGYSCAYLTNLTKRLTERTIHNWIVERRMTEARFLLLKTDEPVNQIAAKVGYPDSGHFSRQFRQLHKIPPKAWRNKHRIFSLELAA